MLQVNSSEPLRLSEMLVLQISLVSFVQTPIVYLVCYAS